MPPRKRLVIGIGNLMELGGAVAAVWGVHALFGTGWALVAAGVLAVAAAELVYDGAVLRVSLPHRPRPVRWLRRKAGR